MIKDLLELHPNLPISVLSMHDETVYAERALRAGAKGYIMKEAGGEKLLVAIRRVLNGQAYVRKEMSAKIVNSLSETNLVFTLPPNNWPIGNFKSFNQLEMAKARVKSPTKFI